MTTVNAEEDVGWDCLLIRHDYTPENVVVLTAEY